MDFPGQFPNLSPPFHGLEPILPRSWQALKDRFGFASERDYLKHILEAHDGEARLIGDGDDWTPFPVSDGVDVSNPCFWHHQFAKNREVRGWLYQRQHGQWREYPFTSWEIEWVMEKERKATTLLKFTPENETTQWWIRKGKYISLVELLFRR